MKIVAQEYHKHLSTYSSGSNRTMTGSLHEDLHANAPILLYHAVLTFSNLLDTVGFRILLLYNLE